MKNAAAKKIAEMEANASRYEAMAANAIAMGHAQNAIANYTRMAADMRRAAAKLANPKAEASALLRMSDGTLVPFTKANLKAAY